MAQNAAEGRTAMAQRYSTVGARAKSSEVTRRVRAGQRIVIAYRGGLRAAFRPLEATGMGLGKPLVPPEGGNGLGRGATPTRELWSRAHTRGVLAILVFLALAITPALAADTSKAG